MLNQQASRKSQFRLKIGANPLTKSFGYIPWAKSFGYMLLLVTTSVFGDDIKNTMTIYSTATPGIDYSGLMQTDNPHNIPGYAIVNQQRDLDLKQGGNKILFTGIPRFIDPSSVMIKSMTDPEQTRVLAQEYRFDLVNNQSLLQRYIGQDITAEQNTQIKTDSYSGKLLSVLGGVILEDKNGGMVSLNNYSVIHFPKLNPAIFTEPTLICDIASHRSGIQRIETSYLTDGLSWWTEYNALFQNTQSNEGFLDLSAWVNILNKAGTSFPAIDLHLMAGEPNRLKTEPRPLLMGMAVKTAGTETNNADEASGFSEKSFFEYHLYSFGRKISLEDNAIKQLELFSKIHKIPVTLEYYYISNEPSPLYGQPNLNRDPGIAFNTQAENYIKFTNVKEFGLGHALPRGRFRIYKNDQSGGLLLIGESMIPHTPKGEEVVLKVGTAFDITIDRIQSKFTVDEKRKTMEESFEIKVKNQKNTDITLRILENVYRGANWSISDNNEKYEKKDAQTIQFLLPIKKESENMLRYTVTYRW